MREMIRNCEQVLCVSCASNGICARVTVFRYDQQGARRSREQSSEARGAR